MQSSRIIIPPQVDGYFRRAHLLERCQPLARRVTVLRAPCGFGKTALLNDVCHRERDRGTLVAWVRLDQAVTGHLLLTHLAQAFAGGGLDPYFLRMLWTDEQPLEPTVYQVGMLMRAIEDYGKPCLIAFDELERLAAPEAVALVDRLLQRGPSNLHFAAAMRPGQQRFDFATAVLEQQGTILTADDLRFSNPEIALFLGSPLSRENLVAAVERTEGWPAALRLYRNFLAKTHESNAPFDLTEHGGAAADFPGVRLMRGVNDEIREFLLDVSLFDGLDSRLVDDVLGGDHTSCRLEILSRFEGLIQTIDPAADVLRLHPMVREYCVSRRRLEDAGRLRLLNRRIAAALASRGQLTRGLQHAAAVGANQLAGEILEDAGGLTMILSQGIGNFLSADRFLTPGVLQAHPRLALMRCLALMLRSQVWEATALYGLVREQTGGFVRDRKGGDDRALRVEQLLVQAALLILTCQGNDADREAMLLRNITEMLAEGGLAPAARGSLHAVVCITAHQRGRLDWSHQAAMSAKECFSRAGAYIGRTVIDFHLGIDAMAQGRVREAIHQYTREGSTMVTDIMLAELHIERNKPSSAWARASSHRAKLRNIWGWFDVHAAAHGNCVEMAFETGGVESALAMLDESLSEATNRNLPSLVRLLAAQRISYLSADGRAREAQRAWRTAGLPDRLADQLDLKGQTWREMEAICCARVRLLRTLGEFESARHLTDKLREVAQDRGLTRTLMRCLAERMVLEHQASNPGRATAPLLEFLRLFRRADYSRSLVRHRQVSIQVIQRLLDMRLDVGTRVLSQSLLEELGQTEAREKPETPRYTAREINVLKGLESGQRNKEIARRLGLTEDGVRYHLKNIYRKVGASGRVDAVRRARNKGIL